MYQHKQLKILENVMLPFKGLELERYRLVMSCKGLHNLIRIKFKTFLVQKNKYYHFLSIIQKLKLFLPMLYKTTFIWVVKQLVSVCRNFNRINNQFPSENRSKAIHDVSLVNEPSFQLNKRFRTDNVNYLELILPIIHNL